MATTERLNGEQILVVEEQLEIAALTADMIERLGGRIVGPVQNIPDALRLLAEHTIDAAVLDVKIEGKPTTPIAEELARRSIPWAFASANPQDRLRERYPDVRVIRKPFSADQLGDEMVSLLDRAART